MKKILFSFLIILILGSITTALVLASNDNNTETEKELNQKYERYVNEQGFESIEIHPQQSYIFSLYQVENTGDIGVLEFSPDVQKKAEAANSSDLIYIPLKGQHNNYMGIKFNKHAENVKYFTIKIGNETKSFDVNKEDDKTFTNTYLIQTDFDPDKVVEISIFDKNDKKLYSISR
ncbi:hypothetical protein [Metabacillus halosaccharovorans]|uniref:hypothetical protein n=1 Tax=Metabacillus halosaccharovorans TaxID=930124 RepID=UPI001C1F89EE|nr:hypothetical protein [Metabacillus halosaccharovorans]MBU7594472.1 hypothetical protein [Metabacillus halosaccharovorans]